MIDFKIAFITGQSNKGVNVLSPIQRSFLQAIKVPEENKVYQNFPYFKSTTVFKDADMITASINNGRQYFQSRQAKFKKRYAEWFLDEFEDAEKIILLSGSCGLEIFQNFDLAPEIQQRIHIFAYGAVARKLPECNEILLVKGDKDWIASLWGLRTDVKVQAGHLDYLEKEEVLQHCQQFVDSVLTS